MVTWPRVLRVTATILYGGVFLVALGLGLGQIALPSGRSTDSEPRESDRGCLETNCHATLRETNSVHWPVIAQLCHRCHRPKEGEEHAFVLEREAEELCVSCHASPAKEHVHSPFEKRACLSCHNPHGGATSSHLVTSGTPGKLCLSCHDNGGEGPAHGPYAAGECSQCHVAHQSDHASRVRDWGRDLCSKCHSDLASHLKSAEMVHSPVASGQCTSCHQPHGSGTSRGLRLFQTTEFYEGFDEKKYELCFSCHRSTAFLHAETEETGFRDGTRSLHYLHVNSPTKGRTCFVCHCDPPHASRNPRLIRNEVTFGAWHLPIGFEVAPDGGSCTPGCHRQATYSRASAPGTRHSEAAPRPRQ